MINLGQMRWLPPPPVAWEGPTTNDRRSTLASLTKKATQHRGMEESNGKCSIKEQHYLTKQMRHGHLISFSKKILIEASSSSFWGSFYIFPLLTLSASLS